jgi:hypothetical protein
MKDLALPTIHLNGTSARSLTEQYSDARIACEAALTAVIENGPHGRDYYVQTPDGYPLARTDHLMRCAALRKVVEELTAIETHCAGFIK